MLNCACNSFKRKRLRTTFQTLIHCCDIWGHALWIFYNSPKGELWHLQSNQTTAPYLLTLHAASKWTDPIQPIVYESLIWKVVCQWNSNLHTQQILHNLHNMWIAWVKDFLQINLGPLLPSQYIIAGIYWTSTIKTVSKELTGCQIIQKIHWLSNICLHTHFTAVQTTSQITMSKEIEYWWNITMDFYTGVWFLVCSYTSCKSFFFLFDKLE